MAWRTAAERMCSPTLLHICGSSSSVHDLVAKKELSVSAQELHTLQVSSQETVAQIKALYVVSLESTAPKDQVLLLSGMPREDEATLGQCGLEVLGTLEVASLMLGPWFPGPCWESKGQTPKVPNKRKRRQTGPRSPCSRTSTLSVLCPLWARRATVPTLKSSIILAFSKKPT